MWNSSPVPYIAYVDDHAVGMDDLPVFPPYHPSDLHITVHTGIRERKSISLPSIADRKRHSWSGGFPYIPTESVLLYDTQ